MFAHARARARTSKHTYTHTPRITDKVSAAAARISSAANKLFKRPAANPTPSTVDLQELPQRPLKDERESGSLLQVPTDAKQQAAEAKQQASILEFAAVEPQMSARFRDLRAPKASARSPPAYESRGAAALQLFLIIYISPVEICLKMLTCYTLADL